MNGIDWLLMLSRDGVVDAVDGGAPASFIGRRVDECAGLPDAVKSAARRLVRDLAEPGTLLRRVRVEPEAAGAPSFSLVAVEAIPIRPVEVALVPLVRRALAPLLEQAAVELIALHLDASADERLAVSIDVDKIAWALGALVGNALRYVRRGDEGLSGGNVRVHVAHSAAQRMVNVTVQDDGPGIPAGVRRWLLEPDPETGRTAGVGLRLVHDIVAAHGGGMVIKSSTEPRSRGTTVTLWLPARG